MGQFLFIPALLAGTVIAASSQALAQRADDNATTQAGDAFGFSVGGESVGLYNAGDVRGFNPSQAGNVRINGLYFDEQASLPNKLIDSTTIRVGLSALDFDLPAPSGIVDQSLRIAKKTVVTTTLGTGDFFGPYIDVEGGWVSTNKRWAVTYGAGVSRDKFDTGATSRSANASLLLHGTLSEDVDITLFGGRYWYYDDQDNISIFPSNDPKPFLPPQFKRRVAYNQPWGEGSGNSSNVGTIIHTDLGHNWDFKLGAFWSQNDPALNFEESFVDVTPDGRGTDKMYIQNPETLYQSLSGEARLSKTLNDGARTHVLSAALRGRINNQRYGGGFDYPVSDFIGTRQLGVLQVAPEPNPIFTAQTHDDVKQVSGALSYRLSWHGVGLLNLGIQKVSFKKTVDDPADGPQTSTASPVLFNASLALELNDQLVLFGGYTRGLEESGAAPSNANNRYTVLPAVRTTQRDIGLRWAIAKNTTLIAAVFDLRRPSAGIDAANVYGFVGNGRNRGLEISINSKPLKGLSVVLGALFLDAKLSGATVIAPRPLGTIGRSIQADISYDIPGITGLSINSTIRHFGGWVASRDNSLNLPDRTVPNLGMRYRFKAFGGEHVARATLDNIFDNYGWRIFGDGGFNYNPPRRFSASLTSDW
jgi:iron complex outermembrane recepter protein